MAEQATNVFLPFGGVGGLALGAWALRQGGMSVERIARRSVAFFVVTSIPNFLCAAVFGTMIAFGAPGGHAPFALSLVIAVRGVGDDARRRAAAADHRLAERA